MEKFDDVLGLKAAIEQAKKSASEGGVPIGSSIVANVDGELKVIGASHNQRIQRDSAILHGETATLEQAGRLKASVYRNSTIVSINFSPCDMCTGAILLYKIPRVVIGENVNFLGGDEYLRARGVEVIVVDNQDCKDLISKFIKEHPEEWNEDIGEP
ncbi:cytosine deaminase [Phellopilus nigrolimitatus]|nr:cytosine deaminase [Phellopilus nigrolimitatus]